MFSQELLTYFEFNCNLVIMSHFVNVDEVGIVEIAS